MDLDAIYRMTMGSLDGLFVVHYIVPWTDLLEEFLHIWESIEDGRIRAIVCREKITIDETLITQQFGVNTKGVVDAVNTLVKEVQVALKNIIGPDAFINKEQWRIIWMKEE